MISSMSPTLFGRGHYLVVVFVRDDHECRYQFITMNLTDAQIDEVNQLPSDQLLLLIEPTLDGNDNVAAAKIAGHDFFLASVTMCKRVSDVEPK